VDLFTYTGIDYVLCIDYFSKYPEIASLSHLGSFATIERLKSFFSPYGIPDIVVSDNGLLFSSYKFQEFADQWEFEHITSSSRYPQSNGQAERFVQTVKNCLKKADDIYLALLDY